MAEAPDPDLPGPVVTGPANRLPGNGDDVTIPGVGVVGPGGSAYYPDCNGLIVAGGGAFQSLTILSNYTGTVTFGGAITTGAYSQGGGAISQPSSGTDLTVTSTFNWSGGTLNSSTNQAIVHLRGATGTISPGAGNVITTGSTLSFENNGTVGSTVTFNPGEVDFAGGTGIDVNDLCSVNMAPKKTAEIRFKTTDGRNPSDGKNIVLKNGSTYRIFGENDFPATGEPTLAEAISDIPMVMNTGSKFTIEAAASARFEKKSAGYQLDATKFGSILQFGGLLSIESGSELSVEKGVQMLGGTLQTTAHATLAAAKQVGAIWGSLRIDSITNGPAIQILINAGSTPHKRGYLSVSGDVKLNAGTYKPNVDASDSSNVDAWIVLGSVTIGSAAKIAPVTQNFNSAAGLPANYRAKVFVANGGITGIPAVESTQPSYQLFVLQPGGNERDLALGPN